MAKITKIKYVKPQSVKNLEEFALEKLKEKNPFFPYPPRPKYRDDTSNGLTKCVVDSINLCGFQAERINSTGRPLVNKAKTSIGEVGSVKWIKSSSKTGTADISATIKGRSIKIEIKCKATGDNYQSDLQKQYQKEVERAGGVYLIVRDFTGFYNWFKRFLKYGK